MKASRLPKARENAGDQVVIDFSLAFESEAKPIFGFLSIENLSFIQV